MIVITEQAETNWVPIISALISFLAVSVAILSIWLQQWQYKKKREPVVSPTTKSFKVQLPKLDLDWETKERLDRKISNTSIPLYNFGGTTAHNISYSFRLVNLLTLKEQLDRRSIDEDMVVKIDKVNNENNSFDLLIKHDSSLVRLPKIRWFNKRSDLISPGEKIDVFLPSYFIVLLNYIFRLMGDSVQFAIDNPILELTVEYNDVDNDNYIVKYRIRLDHQFSLSGPGLELDSDFIYEFVSKQKRK